MTLYICANCGEGAPAWIGKCPTCGEWNSFKQQRESGGTQSQQALEPLVVKRLSQVPRLDTHRIPTGLYEFDRVLGGGIVRGSVVLLTGEPGIGKSTLLLQALKSLRACYISGEEAAEQVKDRAERLNIPTEQFYFSDTLQVEGICEGVEKIKDEIDIVVIDSIQTVYSKSVDSVPGSVSQLRESSAALIRMAKELKIPLLLVGHVTKDGDIAGPKTLEHMVDTVLVFEGDPVSQFRILRGQKNRFGTTDEIGIFMMKGVGLIEVNDPLIFVDARHTIAEPGKAVVSVMEGKRTLFYEIQTLCSPSILPVPRRIVNGVDYNKVLLILAVLRKHLNLSVATMDVYINVVGGVDIHSTSADLGIAASILSAAGDLRLPAHALFIGELGLLGEVRAVSSQEKMIQEGTRLKFNQIYSPVTIDSIKTLKRELSKGSDHSSLK